jgi:hypothetical protein
MQDVKCLRVVVIGRSRRHVGQGYGRSIETLSGGRGTQP